MQNSVLVSQDIRRLVDYRVITADSSIEEAQIQPASLDIRLGEEAYVINESFLPRRGKTIDSILRREGVKKLKLDKLPELKPGRVYLIPLQESVALLPGQEGKANPKSSAGRIDLFTRLLVDGHSAFDRVPKGHTGRLYLLVIPQSFSVLAYPGITLSQLRLFEGQPRLDDTETHLALRKDSLIYYNRRVADPRNVRIQDGIYLTIGMKKGVVAYRAKKTRRPIDLSKESNHDRREFWDEIESNDGRITLEPGFFYLLSTREGVRIPPSIAAELEAVNVTLGDFRSHYAGFFDPGFGFGEDGSILGNRVTLEVRPMEHKFRLEDGQYICRLVCERTSEKPDKVYGIRTGSHYQGQSRLALAKYFKN